METRCVAAIAALSLVACGSPAAPAPSTPAAAEPGERGGVAQAPAKPWEPPDDRAPRRWLVLGPFVQDPATREAVLDRDFLGSIGGEAGARIAASTVVEADGRPLHAREAELDPARGIDFLALYPSDADYRVAYAYAEITRERAEVMHAIFGSDDGASVWLNGARIHHLPTPGRALDPNADHFPVQLLAGVNRLLVKVENARGGWAFALRLVDEEGQARVRWMDQRRSLEALELGPASRDFSLGESFPPLVWQREEVGRAIFGDEPPRVRWFGPDLELAERPTRPGRYIAVVEATTRDGYLHRRMLTFAKVPPGLLPLPRPIPPLAELPAVQTELPANLTEAQRAEVSRHMWRAFGLYMREGEEGAIAQSALVELAERPPPRGEPAWLHSGFIAAAEQKLALRRKLEGRPARPLAPPARLDPPAPELRVGNERRAGMRPGTAARLRQLGKAYLADDPNGFVVLVARRGVVFLHEGFGGFGREETFMPASIGKLIAGLTFARAVDQGLVAFDDPLGSVLPDWNQERTARLTFRHCFNHVIGLNRHFSHGGLFNAYLDNAFLVQDLAFVEPLRRHEYNGDGYNLTGKALELITGQSIWRLLYENLEKPFGEPVSQFDLGFGGRFTARYLAEVGQMILQDGAYGAHRFYEPGFLATLRPIRVADHAPGFPDPKLEWGIGQTWMPDPESGPREQGILGPNVFGHGASSGTVFRIDPDHELVVVIGRNDFREPEKLAAFAAAFMKVLAEGLAPPE